MGKMNREQIKEKLMDYFETDIDKFFKLHNELGLDFVKEGREEAIKKEIQTYRCSPDLMLTISLTLSSELKRKGYENE